MASARRRSSSRSVEAAMLSPLVGHDLISVFIGKTCKWECSGRHHLQMQRQFRFSRDSRTVCNALNYAYLHAQVNARVKSQVNCCRLITAMHSLLVAVGVIRDCRYLSNHLECVDLLSVVNVGSQGTSAVAGRVKLRCLTNVAAYPPSSDEVPFYLFLVLFESYNSLLGYLIKKGKLHF